MLRLTATIALCLFACGKSAKPKPVKAGDIALVGATVVPMDREGTLANYTVVVRGEQIVR